MQRPLGLRRRLVFAAFTTVLAFALLEGGLRLVGHFSLHELDIGPEGDFVLWAYGDSNTFGIGADEPRTQAWPVVAGRLLGERLGVAVTVHNGGVPGDNSSRSVRRFAEDLQASERAPDVVALLTGLHNDGWVVHSGQYCVEPSPEPGRAGTPLLRRSATFRLLEQVSARTRRSDQQDDLCDHLTRAFDAIARSDHPEAARLLDSAAGVDPDSAWLNVGRGVLAIVSGRAGEAVAPLAVVREPLASRPAVRLLHAWALRAAGRVDEARGALPPGEEVALFVELVGGWLDRDEGDLEAARARFERVTGGTVAVSIETCRAWEGIAWVAVEAGDQATADAAFRRYDEIDCVNRYLDTRPGWGFVARALAAVDRGNIEEARTLASAALVDWTARSAATTLLTALDGPALDARSLAAELQPMPALQLAGWVADGDHSLMVADLERAGRLATAHGVVLAVATYPWPSDEVRRRQALEAFAWGRAGTVLVDFEKPFRARLDEGVPWDQLFIEDGHPTTEGYALMGRELAEAVSGLRP